MEIKITENQLDRIKKNDIINKTFFKFWDKRGGYIDSTLFSLFGFKNGRLKIDDVNITIDDVRNLLIEWRGDEETRKLAEKILNENEHESCHEPNLELPVHAYCIMGNFMFSNRFFFKIKGIFLFQPVITFLCILFFFLKIHTC